MRCKEIVYGDAFLAKDLIPYLHLIDLEGIRLPVVYSLWFEIVCEKATNAIWLNKYRNILNVFGKSILFYLCIDVTICNCNIGGLVARLLENSYGNGAISQPWN